MSTKTALRPAVRDLIRELEFRADPERSCWLIRVTAGRYSLIVPAMYGPLDWLRLIDVRTVEEAVAAGLVTIGEPELMPPFNYGGPKYRWCTVQQGQRIALVVARQILRTGGQP